MNSSAANASFNLATLTADARALIEADKQACLERFNQARQIADRVFLERHRKGWRMWAEREIAKHPGLDVEIRRVLNWRLKARGSR